jgi:dihydropteroate synthase
MNPSTTALQRVIGRRSFDFSRQVAVMAIINRTRDSFYDKGRTYAFDAAAAAIDQALEAGADWVDIGAVPFSPISAEVDEKEELDRIVPLIEDVRPRTNAVISVDTFRAEVARQALQAGADVINDTSGLHDPDLARVIAEQRKAVVITHSKAAPREWLSRPTYGDVVGEVREFLVARSSFAVAQGIDPANIIVDPGHDLNKNTYHSLEVTRRLAEFSDLGFPLLVSVSNKDFLAETVGLPFDQLGSATVAAVVFCILQGARIVRVHDTAAAVSAVNLVGAILGWQAPLAPHHNLS